MTSSSRPSSVGGGRRVQRGADHRAVREHGRVGAGPDDPGGVQRVRAGEVGVDVDLALLPVAALGLEEDDRVVGGDRLLDHRVRVRRVRAGDDLEAGGVREVRLGRLGVVLDRADAAAERDPDDDRQP